MSRKRKVLAVASGGGHWVQLRRIVPAFDGHDLSYVTINPNYRADVPNGRVFIVRDSTRWDRLGMAVLALQILWILVRIRPDVVVSTGAAPGCLAIILGRFLGCRTVWLDSIANVDEMSMSGRLVQRYSQLWLTQWSHLAAENGPEYAGRVF
ncbi:MAG: UDP-N-acetylglucosamine--LPS N-acetylglucosamine transferase [Deltaproteobacteria bacterium]|nr:UDP-N-acetylglucosamine--LPS N-acetylglucosamine transferase [Deltaproteobacteria bacterium]